MAASKLVELKERQSSDVKRLEELITARRELREVLRQEFMRDYEKHFSKDELEAIEVAEPEEVIKIVLDKAHTFIQESVDEYDAEIKEFKSMLEGNNKSLEAMDARERFMTKHPEVDMDAVEDYAAYDILPRKMTELMELPLDERLEEVLKLYNAEKGKDGKTDKFPDDVDGVAGATGNIDQGEADSTNDDNFAENYGQNR